MLASYNVNGHFVKCIGCNGWVDPQDYVPYNDCYCAECAKTVGKWKCADCNDWHSPSDLFDFDGDTYCVNCVGNHAVQCEDCDDWFDCDDMMEHNGDHYCHGCFDNLGLSFCDGCDEYHEFTYECGRHYYCYHCAMGNGYRECEACDTWSDSYNCVDDETLCDECFSNNYTYCEGCDEAVHLDRCVNNDDGTFCPHCAGSAGCSSVTHCKNMPVNPHDRVGSPRRYGVELETNTCGGYNSFCNKYWEVKSDPSIRGMEFVTSICNGNDGFDAISDLCDYAEKHNWTVDRRCGYHLHIDVSNESPENLKAIAFAYKTLESIWNDFIESDRKFTRYCEDIKHDSSDYMVLNTTEAWRSFAYNQSRYRWVNWQAYPVHGSVEVRSHQGTLNDTAVCNWVSAHLTFVDWAVKVGCNGIKRYLWGHDRSEQLDRLHQIWQEAGCEHLVDFYKEAVCA